MLFMTGVRVSELSFLRADDVNLSTGTVHILGKGSKERQLIIGNKKILKLLSVYREKFSREIFNAKYFFINRIGNRLSEQSIRYLINKYTALANIHLHITPHMFRHSFATLLLEENVDIRYIQSFLGHSSIVTTQIYTHVATAKQRRILTEQHPRNRIDV
jgi:integrase/recombinase XerD